MTGQWTLTLCSGLQLVKQLDSREDIVRVMVTEVVDSVSGFLPSQILQERCKRTKLLIRPRAQTGSYMIIRAYTVVNAHAPQWVYQVDMKWSWLCPDERPLLGRQRNLERWCGGGEVITLWYHTNTVRLGLSLDSGTSVTVSRELVWRYYPAVNYQPMQTASSKELI